MTTATKREKLHDFINDADDKKVEAIYSLIENEIEESYDHWEDEEFLAEIKKRLDEFESGKVKGISWEQVKLNARKKMAARNK